MLPLSLAATCRGHIEVTIASLSGDESPHNKALTSQRTPNQWLLIIGPILLSHCQPIRLGALNSEFASGLL